MSWSDHQNPTPPEQTRTVDQPTPELPAPIGSASSPLWPQHLVDLFFRPARFFGGNLALGKTPFLLLVTWVYGMASTIDRIDQRMVRAEFQPGSGGWQTFGPWVTESWVNFWILVSIAGALGGLALYWIGGWWFRVRLTFSDAPDPNTRLARLLYIYASFVYAGPAVFWTVLQTFWYPHYQAAYDAEELYSMAFLVFPFWSIWISYRGVLSLFPVSRGKARVWFLILPALLLSAFLAVIVVAFVMASWGAPADIENPSVFSSGSMSFSYPGNWEVSKEGDGTFAIVEAPQDAVIRIDRYESEASQEEEVEYSLSRYTDDLLSDCREAVSLDELGAYRGFGRSWECEAEGEPYKLMIFTAEVDGQRLEIMQLYVATAHDAVKPGFDLVLRTLEVGGSDGPR